MRHFYCRDVLWDIFEQMANDFDCSIDYLINEAMRYYARSKNYAPNQGPTPYPPPQSTGQAPSYQASTVHPTTRLPPAPGIHGPGRRPPPPPGGPSATAMPSSRRPSHHANRQVPAEGARKAPSGARPSVEVSPGDPVLYLIFNNQRIPIDKDQFIIGRGSKTSDLAIKDGNISRKHAAIIRRNGTFYIKDLGSTNGIDYKGMRIDNKRIDEGDVFHLCDYELRFTYRC